MKYELIGKNAKKVISSFNVKNGKIIVRFLSGDKRIIAYDEEDEKLLLKILWEQAKIRNCNEYIENILDKFFVNLKKSFFLSFASFNFAVIAMRLDGRGQAVCVGLSALLMFFLTNTSINVAAATLQLFDIKKYNLFISICEYFGKRMDIYGYLQEKYNASINSLDNISYGKMKKIYNEVSNDFEVDVPLIKILKK